MFKSYKRVSEDGITAYREDGSAKFIERGHKEWDAAEKAAGPYVPPPEPTPAEVLAQWRSQASLPRSKFILAALDAGVLTEADAEQAVNGWPSGWDAFFDGLPARDRIAAKAEWASITRVRRSAPLVAQLAAFKGLTDEQVDALFGINV